MNSNSLKSLFSLLTLLIFSTVASAQLMPYSEDFEGFDPDDPVVLGDNDWWVFGNVFDSNGTFLFGYGAFPAPNNPGFPAFSNVASGEGGPDQGAIQLNTLNDYQNADHANVNPATGTFNTIQANLFREFTVGPDDLGTTWVFTFDAKASTEFGPAPPSTTGAFLQVLDSLSGTFSQLGNVNMDTTNISDQWQEGLTLSLTIDPAWEGQLLQFGFQNTASEFSPTGIFYDNLSFDLEMVDAIVPAASFNTFRGNQIGGTLADVQDSDDTRLEFNPGFTINSLEAPVWIEFEAVLDGSASYNLNYESQAGTPGITVTAEQFNFNTSSYDIIGTAPETFNVDTVETFPVVSADHIDAAGGTMSRLGWRQTGFIINFPWEARIDQVFWEVQ